MLSISKMTHQVVEQANEVNALVNRLRAGNRRMTGATGEGPTPIGTGRGGSESSLKQDQPPLLHGLDHAIEMLNAAMSDLRAEVSYIEGFTETASDEIGHAQAPTKAIY